MLVFFDGKIFDVKAFLTISFALSTTTDAGVTISTSGQITNDPDAAGGAGTASGMTALTFGFANGTIKFADDVAVPGAGKVVIL